jgi:septal ring factor EnvC (AmiA/AmiB activator)
MKKWIFILVIIIVVGVLLYLKFDWQVLTMIGAAIAAPFKFLAGLFGKNADQIRKEHEQVRQRETEFQERLEAGIRQKEEQIKLLEQEMSDLDIKIKELEQKKSEVDSKYNKMGLQELSEVGANYFGS